MKKTLLVVSAVFVSLSSVGLVAAWRSGESCPFCSHAAAAPRGASLAPTDAVHPMFTGCQSSCGSRSHEDRAQAHVQPVAPGQITFCPVSGAVFRVDAQSAHRLVAGRTLYFCCESCAGYFDQNRAAVLELRGLAVG